MALVALLLFATNCAGGPREPVIWFQAGIHELRTINPRTLEESTVIAEKPDTFVEAASLAPSGGKIAFTRTVLAKGSAIWLANLDGSNQQRVTRDYERVGSFWLTDSQLAVAGIGSQDKDPFAGEVAVYDLSTRQLKPLTVRETPPCETHIAMGLEAGTTVPPPQYALGHLQVTEGRLEIVADIPIAAGGLVDTLWSCMSWTPDAKEILFDGGGYNNRDLFVAVDGGKTVRRITNFARDFGRSNFHGFSLSPDGAWAAFVVELDDPLTVNAPNTMQVGLARTDGSEVSLLIKAGLSGPLVWAPDSRYVAAGLNPLDSSPEVAHVLHIIDVMTKEVKRVVAIGDDLVFDWR